MASSNKLAEWKSLLVLYRTGNMGVEKKVIQTKQNFFGVLRGIVVDEVENVYGLRL